MAHKVAQFKNAIISAERETAEAEEQIQIWQNKRRRSKEKTRTLQSKINEREQNIVTDHAIVRYMERVMGINMDNLRKTIVEDKTVKKIFKDGRIVTVGKK